MLRPGLQVHRTIQMPSNINPYNIDGTFPVAGQDNSSQGFRDNFTNIKNNFTFAQSEIDELQSKSILTSALSGQTISNDMAGTQIVRPQLRAWTEAFLDLGHLQGPVLLSFAQANFQKLIPKGDIQLDISDWPTGTGSGATGYGVLRLWLFVDNNPGTGSPYVVTLPNRVSVGVSDIAGYYPEDHSIHFDAPGDYIFDFSSSDNGESYLISDLSRNRTSFRDSLFYFNNVVVPTLMVGYGSGLQTALELEAGQDIISSLGSINSVAIGDLSTGNIKYNQIDTGSLGGYSVTAARGNIALGTISNVQPGDYLGYVDAVACVNDSLIGTPDQFQAFNQLATINFWNTGSNYGGNVGIFTAPNGGVLSGQLNQAVGIENDQSVKIFGNAIVSNVYVPTSSTSPGVKGQISYDNGNIYICLGPNNWKKASLTLF